MTIDYGGLPTWIDGVYGDTLVGYYMDASNNAHGFSETGGAFMTVDFPYVANTAVRL